MEPLSDEWVRSLIDQATKADPESTLNDLDPVARFALVATMLATKGVAVDSQLDSLAISEVSRSTEQLEVKALNDPSRTHGMSLESPRVGLRAPRPDDADIIYQVVNDPQVSWRLPSRGRYVSPDQVFASLSQDTELMLVAYERSSQEPITMLSLTAMSERNGVAEFSFYSLRNSSDPYSGESMEALVCFISHCFHHLGLRKLVASIPEANYRSFGSAEGFAFEIEGVRRDHIKVGATYSNLTLIAIWAEQWFKIEADLGPALLNWQT